MEHTSRTALFTLFVLVFTIGLNGCGDSLQSSPATIAVPTAVVTPTVEAIEPGQLVDAMPNRQHLPDGEVSPILYNSDPPTNGPHVSQVPAFKVYTEPITKELAVHGLEDAGVIINYRPDLDKASVDKLASIAVSYEELGGGKGHVTMAPYPNLSNPVVLTAWRRIDRLDVLDEARIRRFIDAYVGIDHHEGSEGRRIP